MANHQRLLEAILAQLAQREDDEGFVETSAVAALRRLDTNLSPSELYRFTQAITQVATGADRDLCDHRSARTCSARPIVIDVDEASSGGWLPTPPTTRLETGCDRLSLTRLSRGRPRARARWPARGARPGAS